MRVRYKKFSPEYLEALRQVCRLGSYAKAARSMRLSTSVIWEQIRALERQFDAKLVETEGRTALATTAGQRLLELATPILNGLESLPEAFQQADDNVPKQLTVVSGMRMMMEEIAPAIPRFQMRYPATRVRTVFAEGPSVLGLVNSGEADVALTLEPSTGSQSHQVVYEEACQHDYLLLATRDHPISQKRTIRLADVVSYPLVLLSSDSFSRRRIESVLQQHGLAERLQVAVEANSSVLTYVHARCGVGLAITAGNPASWMIQDLYVHSAKRWFGTSRYVFVWRKGAHIPPASAHLAECIRLTVDDATASHRLASEPSTT